MLESLLSQISAFIAAHPLIAVAIGVFLYFSQSPLVTKLPANLQKFIAIAAALFQKLDLDVEDEDPESAADKLKNAFAIVTKKSGETTVLTSGSGPALSEIAADLARQAIAQGNIQVAKCISDHVLPALAGGNSAPATATSEAH